VRPDVAESHHEIVCEADVVAPLSLAGCRGHPASLKRGPQFGDAAPFGRDRLEHRNAELGFEGRNVDLHAVRVGLVDHVEDEDHRAAERR
jgi:hypothetical protein